MILDWVPAHFPTDEHGLGYFDGTHLYEHADPRQGFHPDWGSFIFNYGRNEVRSFLLSSALFWLDHYHVDGLRVDAVASMLYLDYSRKEGEWMPNEYGGRENLEAIAFLRALQRGGLPRTIPTCRPSPRNRRPGRWCRGRPTSAASASASSGTWAGCTTRCDYFAHDPVHRKYHHNELTFRMLYAFTENFVLPLSHDEVVHGKGSLLGKMPGDDWQKFANLRLLLGYMYAQPGKKLLFMGGEFGQWREWNHDTQPRLAPARTCRRTHGVQRWVRDLNRLYRGEPALHELDCDPAGFEWIDCNDCEHEHAQLPAQGRRRGRRDAGGLQLHAGAAPRLPRRRAARRATGARLLNSDAPHLRRQRPGQRRRRRGDCRALPRPPVAQLDPAAAGRGLLQGPEAS